MGISAAGSAVKRSSFVMVAIGLSTFLISCRASRGPEAPPRIRYGQDACAACGMIISEEAFAAAYKTESGNTRKFDDIGCLLKMLKEEAVLPSRAWVHDYDSGSWVAAETASYVKSPETPSPMGYGLAAFATREEAEAFALKVKGRVLSFDALKAGR